MKYAYYPGCSLHSTAEEYDCSLMAVCQKMDIQLVEVEKWVCCGSTAAHNKSKLLAAALPMASLALMQKMGFEELIVPCPECFSKLKKAQHHIAHDKKAKKAVADIIQTQCNDEAKIYHPLKIFSEDPLLSRIPSLVKRDLSGLKVACYYGCLITRPPQIAQFDNCESPESMDKVLRAAGIQTLDWNHKTRCCGSSFAVSQPEIVVNLSRQVIDDAKSAGADAIAVGCPVCHVNLDSRQPDMEKKFSTSYDMPILYFSQLLGYSFGISSTDLLLHRHMTKAETVLESIKQPVAG
ncbi:CoB--CoM heterodisulfide reductase iron-sulfur subunit B family protein [Desulfospira joergensenii]|uniref:CoB--CoM heterodisulfide reductase iron-sulfur subunit B family protein n=1 Tax=Desulfospira joergensenii TaxID=53329 RepID=UPI0003B39D00|nr:CoB--CoM heterodisulfide reductase iron-sulfur subunit B family protein [Desulfospira joergensenii]